MQEEASSEAEHKSWSANTQTIEEKTATVEKLRAIVNELKVTMENVAMEVAALSAQVSRFREEASNANPIRHEETATNEEAIKDVQDAQSNLTQAIQILTDFYAKVSSTPFHVECNTVKNFSASTARFGGPRLTTEIRLEVPMSLVPYK